MEYAAVWVAGGGGDDNHCSGASVSSAANASSLARRLTPAERHAAEYDGGDSVGGSGGGSGYSAMHAAEQVTKSPS